MQRNFATLPTAVADLCHALTLAVTLIGGGVLCFPLLTFSGDAADILAGVFLFLAGYSVILLMALYPLGWCAKQFGLGVGWLLSICLPKTKATS